MRRRCGRPAVRGAESPGGIGVPKKRMPGSRKAAGKQGPQDLAGLRQSRLKPQQATLASDRGAEDLRYGLVIACFGLTVKVALRVARSPVWNAPAQPTTW
jgi:hypothetical protein